MKREGEKEVMVKKVDFLTAGLKTQPVPHAPARGGSAAAHRLRPRAAGVPGRECSPQPEAADGGNRAAAWTSLWEEVRAAARGLLRRQS